MGKGNGYMLCLFLVFFLGEGLSKGVQGLACNWGLQSTHPLQPSIVVKLMKDNGFNKVKLFEADPGALKALANSGIQVMVGIPNELLAPLASNVNNAISYVKQNISTYVSKGVDIRYVAVANEPFLKTYKDTFLHTTFPALQNIQAALIKAGLGKQVKVTIPLNADVYETTIAVSSPSTFIPFSASMPDPNFPVDYAFFNGSAAPVVDGSISYTNVFDANFDTLISALEKNGFGSMPVMIGEVGWPTDGDPNANIEYARRFNQGLLDRIIRGQGTPKRSTPPEVYLFSLIDEDNKSVQPGNFERHWGVFYYDGAIKYQLNMGKGRGLIPAKGVKYLARQWCVMSPGASTSDPNFQNSINYACTYADCTSLGYGSSCGNLDAKSNASYAFNMYYQTMNQRKDSCSFSNLSTITTVNPSRGTCRYEIMIDLGKHERPSNHAPSAAGRKQHYPLIMALVLVLTLIV
ncbi:hypothetical protein Patl1_13713 [Pistacia atlantica]|uniref:Uncharacterized protein n=1 Tax=Pistacia atlantica TaxID=434234 RepID=A0ACC1AUQ3_9ROSI|nr:hypothetical protein Patl1_13713 [Pistacia atlantica]